MRNGAGARGVIMAGSGLVLPDGLEQRRHMAFIASTWRAMPDAGRPSSWAMQLVQSREEQPDSVICSEEFSKSVDC